MKHIIGRAAFAASVLCPLLLAGCAKPFVYNKPGATQADYNRDSYECERDTRQSGYFGQCGLLVQSMNKCDYQIFFQRCMLARGWTANEAAQPVSAVAPSNEEQLVYCRVGDGSTYILGRECRQRGGTVVINH